MTRNARIGRIAGGAVLALFALWMLYNTVSLEIGAVGFVIAAAVFAGGVALIASGAIRRQ